MRKQSGFAKVIVVVAVLLTMALVYADSGLAKDAKPGVERWPIKTSLPAGADVNHPKEVQLLRLVILEDPPGVTHNETCGLCEDNRPAILR